MSCSLKASFGPTGGPGYITQVITGILPSTYYQLQFDLRNGGEPPNSWAVNINGNQVLGQQDQNSFPIETICYTYISGPAETSITLQFAFYHQPNYYYLSNVQFYLSLNPNGCCGGEDPSSKPALNSFPPSFCTPCI